MKRSAVVLAALLLGATLATPHPASADQSLATGGAGGIYPPGTTFDGVPINGLQLGFGVEINPDDSSALGQLCTILIGVSPLGLEQDITIEGQITNASRNAANMAVLSGTASVDMGDGLPPTPGIPFTATVTTDANGQGTVGLVLGLTTLPAATVNAGSMTIE